MRSTLRLVAQLVLCVGIAMGAYFLATGMMASIYDYQSPLQANPPIPGQSLGEPHVRQVVFVLIDALRYDTSLKSEVMPNLSKLRSQGAYARSHSRTPSYSSAGYGVLLTGAWPELSSSPPFNLDYEDFPQISQDNIFSSAHRLGLKTGISAFYWFEKLVPQTAVDESFYTALEDQKADRDVVTAALPWIGAGKTNLTLIHLDQVDYAGHHEGGPRNPNWDAAAGRADALVGEILAVMDLKKDVILITSDHGQIDAGGHGGQDPVVLIEPFILAGKGIAQGDYGEMNMVDIAPTVAAILGLNVPASAQGEAQQQMFSGWSKTELDQLALSEATQQSKLLQSYNQALGLSIDKDEMAVNIHKGVADYEKILERARSQRLTRERIPRVVIALAALALVVFLLTRWKFQYLKRFLVGALAYTFLYNLIYLLLGPGLYSYSIIPSESVFIITYGSLSLVVFVLVWFLVIKRGKANLSILETAVQSAQFSVFTALFSALPVIAHWVWNGMFVTWATPALGLHFVALLALVQVIFIAIGGLVVAGLSFLMRKSKKLVTA
ncbi:MAG: hypothetical protein BGO78_06500 [Chloroflexi bacterium 44-23]|nr:MAG: hypothetical protein BGO78_06500 [Chloroflexi bacterium 44-23]